MFTVMIWSEEPELKKIARNYKKENKELRLSAPSSFNKIYISAFILESPLIAVTHYLVRTKNYQEK